MNFLRRSNGASSAKGSRFRDGVGWRVVVLLLLVVYFIQIDNVMKVRPDHAFLSLLIVALVLGNARRFLVDWSPFIALWIAYDFMRGVVDDLAGKIHIIGPYLLEQRLFARFFGGQIPNFAWVAAQQAHAHEGWKRALDSFTSGLYAMHMAMPIVLAWIFWNTLRDRRMFYRFMTSFSLVTWMSFATYFLFPSAPPWYVKDFGFIQPEPSFKGAGAGNLVAADRWIGIPLFESVYKHLNPNKFAAIPSLHSAFPLLIFIFCLKRFGKKAWPVALYPLGVWFSAVYLDHHYLIDVMLAWVYVAVGVVIGEGFVFPFLAARWPLRQRLAEDESAAYTRTARSELAHTEGSQAWSS